MMTSKANVMVLPNPWRAMSVDRALTLLACLAVIALAVAYIGHLANAW